MKALKRKLCLGLLILCALAYVSQCMRGNLSLDWGSSPNDDTQGIVLVHLTAGTGTLPAAPAPTTANDAPVQPPAPRTTPPPMICVLVDFTDVLRHIPGFRVELNRNYGKRLPPTTTEFGLIVEDGRGMDTRRYLISSRRSSSRDDCPPQFVLNGVRMGSSKDFNLDLLNPDTVVGVEAYAGTAGVPMGFSWPGSNCGVLVIWTQ